MDDEIQHIIQKQKAFEADYLSLRKKEGRLYTDEEVARLPHVVKNASLKKEWAIRSASCQRLIKYLAGKKTKLSILEIGCGNGWLSNQLAAVTKTQVLGLDVNQTELAQAQRVFSKPNLSFLYGDVRTGIVKDKFDVIVFAASFQYFQSTQEILKACFSHLTSGGEIHIIDTQFYTAVE
jgi:ubiquinone/menaquinone biosynthesis C-methylase UbiE